MIAWKGSHSTMRPVSGPRRSGPKAERTCPPPCPGHDRRLPVRGADMSEAANAQPASPARSVPRPACARAASQPANEEADEEPIIVTGLRPPILVTAPPRCRRRSGDPLDAVAVPAGQTRQSVILADKDGRLALVRARIRCSGRPSGSGPATRSAIMSSEWRRMAACCASARGPRSPAAGPSFARSSPAGAMPDAMSG
jgi:hypothetical protein